MTMMITVPRSTSWLPLAPRGFGAGNGSPSMTRIIVSTPAWMPP